MQKFIIFSVLSTALLAPELVNAAETTELKVTGSVRPPACIPSFTGDGVIDYGTIPAKSLKAGQFTALPAKDISLTITCTAATQVAYRVADNRTSSKVYGIAGPDVFDDFGNYGLGRSDGKNIGGYKIQFTTNNSADSVAARNITSVNGQPWYANDYGNVNADIRYRFGFTTTASAQPSAFKQLVTTLRVSAFINKPEELNLTHDVPLDGSATFEILYM